MRSLAHDSLGRFCERQGVTPGAYFPTALLWTAAHQLAPRYDLGIGIARGGLASTFAFSLFGLPVAIVESHRATGRRISFRWLDRQTPARIRGQRILLFDKDVVSGQTLARVVREVTKNEPARVDLFLNYDPVEPGTVGMGSVLRNVPPEVGMTYTPSDIPLAGAAAALAEGEQRLAEHAALETALDTALRAVKEMAGQQRARTLYRSHEARAQAWRDLNRAEPHVAAALADERRRTKSFLVVVEQCCGSAAGLSPRERTACRRRLRALVDLERPETCRRRLLSRLAEHCLRDLQATYAEQHGEPQSTVASTAIEAFAVARRIVAAGTEDIGVIIAPEALPFGALFDLLGFPLVHVHVDECGKDGWDRPYRELDNVSAIRNRVVLLIEDDVVTGRTLEKVLAELARHQPASVSLYLGLPKPRQTVPCIPQAIATRYLVPDILPDDELDTTLNALLPLLAQHFRIF